MGKSTRKTIAAALSNSDSREVGEEMTFGPVVTQEEQLSAADRDGLVALNSRRPPRERSPRQKSRRDDDRNKVGAQIGDQLRNLYKDVLEQPVPERFLELLNRLEADTISPPSSKAPGER
ncbi:NepR family anti-sigma factor [Methylosinus sp. Sm6]|uniref:NepR family anti-sigma factor n=1 Tax=Methylosinus sp. Sm6 TaxID=2866948 RepID=UPI001C9A1EB0|nr:NepR family anti-sigma factor [Methylosinus sp. Sm6]MBY6241840.1 hypothetical protein [Methylosinus sp. Sm6]